MSEPLDLEAVKRRAIGGESLRCYWTCAPVVRDDLVALIAEVTRLRVMETLYIEQMQTDQCRKDHP